MKKAAGGSALKGGGFKLSGPFVLSFWKMTSETAKKGIASGVSFLVVSGSFFLLDWIIHPGMVPGFDMYARGRRKILWARERISEKEVQGEDICINVIPWNWPAEPCP
ncbi:MAG: hypothetical protein IIZ39_14405 [Blautia sp.]|nr:hypothetical protein [Blautia sp.]